MKRAIAMFTTAVVMLAGASLYAGDAPQAAPKAEKTQPMMCCMFMEHSDLLTKEQKEKATVLHVACMKENCSPEAQAKFFKKVKAMLSPEQIATCKANCEKSGMVGCPICGGAKPKTEPKS